jgi:hypothetical protein
VEADVKILLLVPSCTWVSKQITASQASSVATGAAISCERRQSKTILWRDSNQQVGRLQQVIPTSHTATLYNFVERSITQMKKISGKSDNVSHH